MSRPRARHATGALIALVCLAGAAACRQQAVLEGARMTGAPDTASSTGGTTGTSSSGTTAVSRGVDQTRLPLGDDSTTTSGPRKGWLYECRVQSGGGGSQVNGPWIDAASGTWDRMKKLSVRGSVSWSQARYTVSLEGGSRVIRTSSLPVGGVTGVFPISSSDPAYAYDRNPNTISAQDLSFSLPASPSAASSPVCLGGAIGVLVNGVALFNAVDGENRDAVAHEVQDSCGGHPERTGEYHVHDVATCLPGGGVRSANVVGWAFDGYPITGSKDPATGRTLTTEDLDECHGTTSTITVDGKKVRTYHYVATTTFPYTLGCFHGTPAVQQGSTGPATTGQPAGQPPAGGPPAQGRGCPPPGMPRPPGC